METVPISLQLIDPNFKPIHARAYTVPRSMENQLQHSKEIVRLVDIGVLEEDMVKIQVQMLSHGYQDRPRYFSKFHV
jgi:hypothetical protein